MVLNFKNILSSVFIEYAEALVVMNFMFSLSYKYTPRERPYGKRNNYKLRKTYLKLCARRTHLTHFNQLVITTTACLVCILRLEYSSCLTPMWTLLVSGLFNSQNIEVWQSQSLKLWWSRVNIATVFCICHHS